MRPLPQLAAGAPRPAALGYSCGNFSAPPPSRTQPSGWSSCATGGSTRPNGVEWLHEPVPSYPTRPGPRDEAAATALKTRTLTSLYNARPQWLADAHAELNAAVAGAYGWSPDISDDDALAELLALNGSR